MPADAAGPRDLVTDPAQAVASIAGAGEPRTALEAVAVIRGWHETLRAISAIAECRVMAAAHVIRREFPDRGEFDAVFETHLAGILDASRGWLMAETWEIAQKNRSIREFARSKPAEAVEFVREFVDTGAAEQLELLGDDDRRLAEYCAMPAKKRLARLRELLALEPAGDGQASAEVPQANTDYAARVALRNAITGLRKLESDAARIRQTIVEHREHLSGTQKRTAIAILDNLYATIDVVAGEMKDWTA